jgi:hypothetical protein
MPKPHWILLLLILWTGCAGQQSKAESGDLESVGKAGVKTAPKAVPEHTPQMAQAPDGEMIPALGSTSAKSNSAKLTGNRADLIREARKASSLGQLEEAIAMVDTLLVLVADDPEALELRGTLMEQSQNLEQAQLDFERCCAKGWSKCCGRVPQRQK